MAHGSSASIHAGSEAEWPLRNFAGRRRGGTHLGHGIRRIRHGGRHLGLLQADWEWLTTQFDILNDPRYVREGGKPVVFIWGLPVPDRNFTPPARMPWSIGSNPRGCHVIGGIPNVWSTLNAAWQTHIAKYDGVLVWMNTSTSDAVVFQQPRAGFLPAHLAGFLLGPSQDATRPRHPIHRPPGRTVLLEQRQGLDQRRRGQSLFLGMFDEYDEGTHIMPMTDDPPPPHTEWGRFIDNQNKPGDWWMMLSDELKRMMLGQRANTNTLPTVESLANRSNIGPRPPSISARPTSPSLLTRAQVGDGTPSWKPWAARNAAATPIQRHRPLHVFQGGQRSPLNSRTAM
jgi:hypothetical protein